MCVFTSFGLTDVPHSVINRWPANECSVSVNGFFLGHLCENDAERIFVKQ